MTLFFAMLALGANALALVVLAALIVPRWRPILAGEIAAYGRLLGVAVAAVTVFGSLYLSEVRGFKPCTLCWYQRIAAYPILVVLLVGWARRDDGARWYVLPLAALGSVVSVYHILIERFPSLESGACDPTNPCSLIWVQHLGFITIPYMALSSFLAQLSLFVVSRWKEDHK